MSTARENHRQRTALYGACLLAAAFLSCWLASSIDGLLSIGIYAAAAMVALIGFIMTFSDLSP
ncbi:MAG: hypothetical protein ABW137_13680 [Mycobacterium sp.]